MKPVTYSTREGIQRRALVPDNEDESAGEYGIPIGPPDLRQLDWDSLIKDMANTLASAGLWTWQDVQRHSVGVVVATNVLKRALIELYRRDDRNNKGGSGER